MKGAPLFWLSLAGCMAIQTKEQRISIKKQNYGLPPFKQRETGVLFSYVCQIKP